MKNSNETDELNKSIVLLENKQKQELIILKDQFYSVYDSLKPINLIKSTFNEVATLPDIKNNFLNNAIGMTTGYLSKKVMVGSTHNPFKNVFGTLLQFAIGNVVAKHSDKLLAKGGSILLKLLKNRNVSKRELEPEYE